MKSKQILFRLTYEWIFSNFAILTNNKYFPVHKIMKFSGIAAWSFILFLITLAIQTLILKYKIVKFRIQEKNNPALKLRLDFKNLSELIANLNFLNFLRSGTVLL